MRRAVVLALLALALGACRAEEPVLPEVIRAIETVTVSQRPGTRTRRFWGTLAASERSDLAFEVPGRVREVTVDHGDRVAAGQLLASLDSTPLRLELDGARAQLRSAQAVLTDASRTVRSVSNLFEKGVASRNAVEQAQDSRSQAAGQVQRAQAAVALAERQLSQASLHAPFSGVITKRSVEPHEEIGAGTTAFVIQNDDALEIEIRVPEVIIDLVSVGQPAQATIAGFSLRNERFEGRVSRIGATATEANSFPVTVALVDVRDAPLRPGKTAEVELSLGEIRDEAAWLVPVTALLPTDPESELHIGEQELFVFLYDADTSTVVRRRVRAVRTQGDQAIIREGLSEGDIVATAGIHYLHEGLQVTLFSGDPSESAR